MRSSLTIWAVRPVLNGAIQSLLSETDLEIARTGLEAELKLLEGIILTCPEDRQLLVLAAQGFTGYAMMFLDGSEPERARLFYERGRKYGIRALSLRVREFSSDELTLKDFNKLINKLKRNDIPAVYWTATAWAQRINLELTSTKSLSESPRATSLMQWVLDNDPSFYYSGPLWFFGTYYSSIPPMLGGNPEKSRQYFEDANKADGEYFLWGKLLYARYYAVQVLDKELYVTLLNDVINGAPNEPDDLGLINKIAIIKAKELLKEVDELF
ncbi:MAG: TRAP transporter TatT component family protein [Candidatus Hatepunaea meridiana]|nr:TRAP transporter TatT component family protein [Candidatus Hatepunaea meridiana]